MERGEELSAIERLPQPILVEIMRFVLADEEELSRGAVPLVSRTWRSRTMEYLATVSQQLAPPQRFLLLRHVAVFRSFDWKMLSSLRPEIFRKIIDKIREDMEGWRWLHLGDLERKMSVFLLQTRGTDPDLRTDVEETHDRFDLVTAGFKILEGIDFHVNVFPRIRIPIKQFRLNARLKNVAGEKFRAEITSSGFTPDLQEEVRTLQKYDIAIHVAQIWLDSTVISHRTGTSHCPEKLLTAFIGTSGSPRILIVATRAQVVTRALGVRKRGEEDPAEKSTIAGGGEYVYSVRHGKEGKRDEGVLVALTSAILPHATDVFLEPAEEAEVLERPVPGVLNRRRFIRVEFPPGESTLESVFLPLDTMVMLPFDTVEEARSAIPYDRTFFSNKIPLKDLEELFMLQRGDIPEKAPGKARAKGNEIFEF